MNMDEFLNSIWTAEEHATSSPAPPAGHHSRLLIGEGSSSSANPSQFSLTKQGSIAGIPSRQLSLPKQGSVTIPSPLFRRTVDEVWSEIQKTHQQRLQLIEVDSLVGHSSSTQKQPTFGEMTLEDFLVKAGVVREQFPPPSQMGPAQVTIPGPLTWYQNNNPGPVPVPVPASTYVSKPTTSIGGVANTPTYPNLPHAGLGATPESSSTAYTGNGKSADGGGGVHPVTPSYNMGGLGIESPAPAPVPVPLSPVSSDGMCGNQDDGSNGGIRGGRKRTIDGPVEKVVERRQRRMIKNRESAARSRARKQVSLQPNK